jgi:sialic acid synthase SpsE
MLTLANAFRLPVGYSDHTPGTEISIAAVALGAEIIEKHITLSKEMDGPDHRASLDPQEFKSLVAAVRNVESSLGDGVKRPAACERKNILIARKSVVAAKEIKRGEKLTARNITLKRPGSGIQPRDVEKVYGRRAKTHFKSDQVITWAGII